MSVIGYKMWGFNPLTQGSSSTFYVARKVTAWLDDSVPSYLKRKPVGCMPRLAKSDSSLAQICGKP